MKKRSIFYTSMLSLFLFAMTLQETYAQWLPPFLQDMLEGNVIFKAQNRIKVFFVLMIGAFLILVVFMIIKGLMDFSRDEAQEISDAGKVMQKQFVAVGGVFVAVLGLAVVLVFFGSTIIQPEPVCIEFPDSYGCWVCQNKGKVNFDSSAGVSAEDACAECNSHPDDGLIPPNDIECRRSIGADAPDKEGESLTDAEIEEDLGIT
ncbi:hypothetical protein GF362_04440 [Candidatus Dojkabacteria bacterium]|nr:hypothetical protein [Candidatus Dojkabacteria bacterium]